MADEDIDSLLEAGIKAAQNTKPVSDDDDERRNVSPPPSPPRGSKQRSSRRHSRSRSPTTRSHSRSRSPRRSSRRRSHRDRDYRRRNSRSRSRSPRRRASSRRSRSRSRSAHRRPSSSSRSSRRRRSRSQPRRSKRSTSPHKRSLSPPQSPPKPRARSTSAERAERAKQRELMELTRDHRTVFVGQLTQKVREKDLATYFELLGPLERVLLVRDKHTNRSKGFAYVEMSHLEDVPRALLLHGRVPDFQSFPLLVKASEAEKNFAAKKDSVIISEATAAVGGVPGNKLIGQSKAAAAAYSSASRLYCGNLHVNVTEDDLRSVFQAFGDVLSVTINRDETGRSRGYGFIQFSTPDEATLAITQANGLELAGNHLRINHVNDYANSTNRSTSMGFNGFNNNAHNSSNWKLEDDDGDSGKRMDAASRTALMAKLAGGNDLFASAVQPSLPVAAATTTAAAVSQTTQGAERAAALAATTIDGAPSVCFVIKNMFDVAAETRASGGSFEWAIEIKQDVDDECSVHGRVVHSFVETHKVGGLVYVLFDNIASAQAAATVLHGRWFNERQLSVRFLAPQEYVGMFPEVRAAVQAMRATSSDA